MQRQDFVAMMDTAYAQITEINRTKGHDYAGDQDALSNFKDEAKDIGVTPEQVWHVYAAKHWSAVKTYVREGDVQSEPIEGRIHDVILYCFLLLGLIKEKAGAEHPAVSAAMKAIHKIEPSYRPGDGIGAPPDFGRSSS